MNFYNPFKLHIVLNADGTYSVRKLFKHGFSKLDSKLNWNGHKPSQKRSCHFNAEEVVHIYNMWHELYNEQDIYVPIKDLIK